MPEVERNWPAWYYGPDNAAQIFDSADTVPEGWVDHPAKVDGFEPAETGEAASTAIVENGEEIDKSGWAWDANRNAANKAMTASGLWQLLPGQSRPAPKPGFPKEALKNFDL